MKKFQLTPTGTKPPYIETENKVATAYHDDLSIYINSEPADTLSNEVLIYDSRGKIIRFFVRDKETAINTSRFNYGIGEPFIEIGSPKPEDLKTSLINGIKVYKSAKKIDQINSLETKELDELIPVFKELVPINSIGNKNSTLNRSDEQLQKEKEVRQFTYASIISSIISLVIFWWLAIVGIFFGIKGLILTLNKSNTKVKYLILYRVLSSVGIIVGIVSWYLYSTSHR